MPLRILITAGPTHEPVDEVRYLANRSSGRMGVSLAQAAIRAGHAVTLLLGPVPAAGVDLAADLDAGLAGLRLERFESTADLERLLEMHFADCDLLIMAAAVADYRPARGHAGKLPRKQENWVLELEPTPDLVAGCAARKRPDQRVIAFALEEPGRLEQRAIEKMRAKGVDAIVANPLETMGHIHVTARVYLPDGSIAAPHAATLDKTAFADWLVTWIDREMPLTRSDRAPGARP